MKPSPRTAEVAVVAGALHAELSSRCPDKHPNLPIAPCPNQSCPWHLDGPAYMNCSFVAFEAVAATRDRLSLEEIGDMLGITREGVRQIEKRAIQRLRLRMKAKKMI